MNFVDKFVYSFIEENRHMSNKITEIREEVLEGIPDEDCINIL